MPRAEGGAAFLGDLLVETDDALGFVPDAYQDAPAWTRESVARLAREDPAVLCPGHGAPVLAGGVRALREALARDGGAA